MSLKPYPLYSASDIAWAPELPPHWRSTRIQRVALIYAGGTPDKTNLSYWTDGSVPWLNSGSVNDVVIQEPSALITEDAASGGRTRWAPAGSVLIALAGQGRTKGMAARLEFASTLNQSMAAIVPSPELEYRFLQYWVGANYQSVRNLAGGDLRDGLNLKHIGAIQVPLPEMDEQNAIAAFLDRETKEIDAFIADQEELIALLTERRTATISHAVTKGLNPSAPTKDSGVAWLGRVPEHWEVSALRRITRVKRGASPRPIDDPIYFDDEGEWAWVRIQDVSDSDGRLTKTTQSLSTLGASHSVKIIPGSLFLSIAGTVGKPCISAIKCCIHDGFVYFPDIDDDMSSFLFRIFESRQPYAGLGKFGTQLNLNTDTVASINVALPPRSERAGILRYLSQELLHIDDSIADAREAIALSRERRAALISAAVTGKIDVRNHEGVD